jgi:hypothetical protein
MISEDMSTAGGSSTASQYQINSTLRQVWDRKVVPTFRSGASSTGSTISSTAIVDINYVFGKVTFNSTQGATVNVDGTYMPMAIAAGAHSYTLSQVADVLDDTDFTSTGFRSKNIGLFDVSLSLNSWEPLNNQFHEFLVASSTSARLREPLVAEVNPGGSTLFARGWFVVDNDSKSGDVSGLEEKSVSMQLDGDTQEAFRWSDQ